MGFREIFMPALKIFQQDGLSEEHFYFDLGRL